MVSHIYSHFPMSLPSLLWSPHSIWHKLLSSTLSSPILCIDSIIIHLTHTYCIRDSIPFVDFRYNLFMYYIEIFLFPFQNSVGGPRVSCQPLSFQSFLYLLEIQILSILHTCIQHVSHVTSPYFSNVFSLTFYITFLISIFLLQCFVPSLL